MVDYFPWMAEIESNMAAAHATGKANIPLTTEGQVFGYDEWPPTLDGFCSLIGIMETNSRLAAAGSEVIYTVQITMFLPSTITIAESQKILTPFIKIVSYQIAGDMTLGGKVASIHPTTRGTFISGPGSLPYGGDTRYPALVFNYDVKVMETPTVAA